MNRERVLEKAILSFINDSISYKTPSEWKPYHCEHMVPGSVFCGACAKKHFLKALKE